MDGDFRKNKHWRQTPHQTLESDYTWQNIMRREEGSLKNCLTAFLTCRFIEDYLRMLQLKQGSSGFKTKLVVSGKNNKDGGKVVMFVHMVYDDGLYNKH